MVHHIYLDVIFILDFIIDYLLLYATGKIGGVEIKRRRLIIAAAVGAIYSVASGSVYSVALLPEGYLTRTLKPLV